VIDIQVHVAGTEDVAAAFQRAGSAVRERVRAEVLAAAELVQARAQETAPFEHGDLRRNIVVKLFEKAYSITAQVFPRLGYGWILGRGIQRQAPLIHAHTRRVSSRSLYAIKRRRRQGVLTPREVATGIAFVKEHHRRMERAADPYMAEAFLPVRDLARANIVHAVETSLVDVSSGGNLVLHAVSGGGTA
jgi:hypothetical protein